METLEALRRTAVPPDAPGDLYVVECIFFNGPDGDMAVSSVDVFPDKALALTHFRNLTQQGMTEEQAARMVAEGGFYSLTYKVKLETVRQYRLLHGLDEPVSDQTP